MAVSHESTEAWARIHVVRGSAPQRLVLRPNEPAQLVIGSDSSAQLCIPEPSVAPRQIDVLWDGRHLWIQDKLRLGCTFVNGQLLNEWLLVTGDILISFGGVRVWMASSAPLPLPAAPDFDALDRVSTPPDAECERRTPTVRLTMTPELEAMLNEAAGQWS